MRNGSYMNWSQCRRTKVVRSCGDFTVQTDKVLEHRRLDIAILDEVERERINIDFAGPGDQNVTTK